MLDEDEYSNYKERSISPQMVLRFSSRGVVEEVLFLSHDASLVKDSYVYKVYKDNRAELEYRNPPRIVSEHVMILLTLEQAKGVLTHVLGIDQNILLWSLYKNLEFSLNDAHNVFDPFLHSRKDVFKNKPTDTIVYLYNTAGEGCIFCVISESDLMSEGVELPLCARLFKPSYREFTNGIIESLMREEKPFRFLVERIEHNKYTFHMDHHELIQILFSSFRKIVIWRSDNDVYYSGDMLNIPKRLGSKTRTRYKQIDVYTVDGKEIIASCMDKVFTVYNESAFSEFISELGWDLMKKTVRTETKTVVHFDATVDYQLNFLIDFDFFLNSNFNPRNILKDQGERITVYIAQNRITMNTEKVYYPRLLEYIAMFILGYLRFTGQELVRFYKEKKVNGLYFTRMCQNAKGADKRRPEKSYVDSETLLRKGYAPIGDRVFRKEGAGDVWVSRPGTGFRCLGKANIYIGFLKKQGDNLRPSCTPCCYSKPTDHSDIFKYCVHGKEFDYEMLPYISRYGRNISINRLTEIPGFLSNDISGGSIGISCDKNRKIHWAKNYPVIYRMESEVFLSGFESVSEFMQRGDIVIVDLNRYNAHPRTVQRYVNRVSDWDPKVYILVQNRLYHIKLLNKAANKPKMAISDISEQHVAAIFNRFKDLAFNMRMCVSDITWSGLDTMVDGKVYTNNINTKYFVHTNIQVIKPNLYSWYIREALSEYFDTIQTEDKEEFENQFVFNVMKFAKARNAFVENREVALYAVNSMFLWAGIANLLNKKIPLQIANNRQDVS